MKSFNQTATVQYSFLTLLQMLVIFIYVIWTTVSSDCQQHYVAGYQLLR